MKRRILAFSGLFVCLALIYSCKKDSAPKVDNSNTGVYKVFTEGNLTTVQNLHADTIIGTAATGQPVGAGRYSFFSLEQKQAVANSDSATTKWDLAFRGTTIAINGGTSGPGGGGAFVWDGIFNNLSAVPADSVFRVDNGNAYAIPAGSGRGWYNYNGTANLLTPLPGKVLVIRTATGKYAKVEILNYYKGGETPSSTASDDVKIKEQRYYTFRFVFQPNGSKNFQ
jgi:hypothetical protein